MLSENLEWFFPETVDEALELLSRPGTMLHGGGTRILKTKSDNISALVDIGKVNLDYINFADNSFYIGAASTFAKVIKYLKKQNKLFLLSESLLNSSSTPLRNRITIGGSVKDFPIWSSLYAPLIALNARIDIKGEVSGIFQVQDYVDRKVINTKHLIKQIIIDDIEDLIGASKRFSVVKFEYPVFTVAVSFMLKNGLISESRLVLTGVTARYQRFLEAENALNGQKPVDVAFEKVVDLISPEFTSDYRYSADYKSQMAIVYFMDLLNELILGRRI